MSLSKKVIIPGVVGLATFAGVAGTSALSGLAASADTAATDTSTTATTDAADSSDATATTAADTSASSSSTATTQPDQSKGGHTANGITETLLTGDTLTKATAAAKAAEPGATVLRAETDAEGAAYEVHMQKSDGSQVTIKLDASFNVTGTESGMGAGQAGASSSSSSTSN